MLMLIGNMEGYSRFSFFSPQILPGQMEALKSQIVEKAKAILNIREELSDRSQYDYIENPSATDLAAGYLDVEPGPDGQGQKEMDHDYVYVYDDRKASVKGRNPIGMIMNSLSEHGHAPSSMSSNAGLYVEPGVSLTDKQSMHGEFDMQVVYPGATGHSRV